MTWRSAILPPALLAALLVLSCAPARPPARAATEAAAESGKGAASDSGPAKDDRAPVKNGREWPMFGGSPARNMANTAEKGILGDFAVRPKGKERNVKWSVELGDKAFGGPVIAGGRLYIGTYNKKPRDPKVKGARGVLMCFRESDGKFLWQITHEPIDDENDQTSGTGEGVVSTPCVEGDRLYYVSNRCELVCADVKGDEATGQGKVLWSYDMMKELDVFPGQHSTSSPLIVGELVYALTSNGVNAKTGKLPKPDAPALVAVNKKTGKLAWSDNRPGAGVMRGQWSNPAAATVGGVTQIIYPGGDGWVYALEAKKGALLWKFDCNPKSARKKPYRFMRGGEIAFIVGTPVVHDNKCYIAVGREPEEIKGPGHLWCIDITKKPAKDDKDLSPVAREVKVKYKEDGKEQEKSFDEFDPNDPANKDSGLVWHYGGPLRPDRRTKADAEREWVFGETMSTVAVHGGLVYASEIRGDLHCVDAKTGKRYWMHDPEEGSWCSPFYVDGKVFYGTDAGELYVFKAGKEANKPRQITLGGTVKVPPVACNGVLYVNTGTRLYAVAKGK